MNCLNGLLYYRYVFVEVYFILQMVDLCLYSSDQQVNATSNFFNTIAKMASVSFHLISGATWVGWDCICALLTSSKLVIYVKATRTKVSTALNTVLRRESSKMCCHRLVHRYEHFVGMYCFQKFPSEHSCPSTKLHGILFLTFNSEGTYPCVTLFVGSLHVWEQLA
jgi:hypothetical protein